MRNGFNHHEVRWIGPRSRGGSNYRNEISFDRMSLIDPKRAYTLIALDLNLFSLAGGGTMCGHPDFTKTLNISGYALNLIKRLKFYDICLKYLNKKRFCVVWFPGHNFFIRASRLIPTNHLI